jgi:hypothetical protein
MGSVSRKTVLRKETKTVLFTLLLDLDHSVFRVGKGPAYANRKEVITTGDTVESRVAFFPSFQRKITEMCENNQNSFKEF